MIMTYRNKYWYFLAAIFTIAAKTHAMQPNSTHSMITRSTAKALQSQQNSGKIIFSRPREDNQPQPIFEDSMARIKNAQNSIYINAPQITCKKLIEEITNAAQRGVNVQATLNPRFPANRFVARELIKAGIGVRYVNNEHRKSLQTDKESSLESWNPTNLGLFGHNTEIMFKTKDKTIHQLLRDNNQAIDQQHAFPSSINGSPLPSSKVKKKIGSKKILEKTPARPTVINSTKHLLKESLLKRIKNSGAGSEIFVATMTIDPDVIDTLDEASKKGSQVNLFLPKTSVNQKNEASLKNANHMNIFIRPSQNYNTQHAKFFSVQRTGQQPISMIATSNFTENSNNEINNAIYLRDPNIHEDIKNQANKYKKQFIPFAELQKQSLPASRKRKLTHT